MRFFNRAAHPGRLVAALLCAAAATACVEERPAAPAARAADEWTRTYPLNAAGALELLTRAGDITVTAHDRAEVEVRAERVVIAATESGARELLPRITIDERASADAVSIEVEGLSGIVIGVEVQVHLRVRAPRGASIRARSRSGAVTAEGFQGAVALNAASGALTGSGLSGGVDARAVNGSIALTLAALGGSPVEARATNGSIALSLPPSAEATIQANITNGSFDVDDALPFEPIGDATPRRVRGRLNGGGTPIDLTVVNGKIRVAGPASVPLP